MSHSSNDSSGFTGTQIAAARNMEQLAGSTQAAFNRTRSASTIRFYPQGVFLPVIHQGLIQPWHVDF